MLNSFVIPLFRIDYFVTALLLYSQIKILIKAICKQLERGVNLLGCFSAGSGIKGREDQTESDHLGLWRI